MTQPRNPPRSQASFCWQVCAESVSGTRAAQLRFSDQFVDPVSSPWCGPVLSQWCGEGRCSLTRSELVASAREVQRFWDSTTYLRKVGPLSGLCPDFCKSTGFAVSSESSFQRQGQCCNSRDTEHRPMGDSMECFGVRRSLQLSVLSISLEQRRRVVAARQANVPPVASLYDIRL